MKDKTLEKKDRVIVRFAGDSGDGMQLVGSRFTATMAASNRPAHRLMSRLTSHLEQRHAGGGVDELVLDLAS